MTVHQQPWFAWREGFCIHGIGRVVEVRDGIVWTLDDATGVRRTLVADALACFTGLRFIWDDDALGALIRLLQERTGDPEAHVRLQSSDRDPAWWSCHVSEAAPGGWMRRGQHASAVDALLFALESCYILEQGSDAIAARVRELRLANNGKGPL